MRRCAAPARAGRQLPLQSLAPRPSLDETSLSLLVSGLAELLTPVVLVLDDLQDISDPTVFQGSSSCCSTELAAAGAVHPARPPLPCRLLVG